MSGAQQADKRETARRVRAAADVFLADDPDRWPALRNHGHQIDAHARAVLARLASTGRASDRLTAAQAIVEAVPDAGWAALFADCIIAEWKARSHKAWISDARHRMQRADEAEKSLRSLTRRLGWTSRPIDDLTPDPVGAALAELRSELDGRRRLSGDHLRLYSRKVTPEAARALGAGWIRDTMECIARRYNRASPEPRHVAAIATATLALGDVSPEAARKAPNFRDRFNALRFGAFGGQEFNRTRRTVR